MNLGDYFTPKFYQNWLQFHFSRTFFADEGHWVRVLTVFACGTDEYFLIDVNYTTYALVHYGMVWDEPNDSLFLRTQVIEIFDVPYGDVPYMEAAEIVHEVNRTQLELNRRRLQRFNKENP